MHVTRARWRWSSACEGQRTCECKEIALPRSLLKSFFPTTPLVAVTSGAKGPVVALLPPFIVVSRLAGALTRIARGAGRQGARHRLLEWIAPVREPQQLFMAKSQQVPDPLQN